MFLRHSLQLKAPTDRQLGYLLQLFCDLLHFNLLLSSLLTGEFQLLLHLGKSASGLHIVDG